MTRCRLTAAVMFALATAVAAYAAEPDDNGPQWPNVALNDDGPQWPRIPDPQINPQPAFIDPDLVTARILGKTAPRPPVRRETDITDVTGSTAQWPNLPPEPEANASLARWPALTPDQPLSPFAFEVGARYWYSGSAIRFGFTNNNPLFGNPTSTLDWQGMSAHTGEVFARLDHRPSGWFVKGLFGGGVIRKGHIDDADFLVNQFEFSNTTSNVTPGNLTFAMADIGWAYQATPEIRLGVFVGYHYWREKVAANGILCNQASPLIGVCPAAGVVVVGYDTAVFNYEPTWHAVRLGFEGRWAITDRWSLSGEFAVVPYAVAQNKDSHLLRQSSTDLGPAPNVITDTRYGFGVETEVFVNYAVTPNLEIGGGLRYWGLASRSGEVRFGPSFATGGDLTKFDQHRYGVLLQIKGKF